MVTIPFLSAFYNYIIVFLSVEAKQIAIEIAKHIVTEIEIPQLPKNNYMKLDLRKFF